MATRSFVRSGMVIFLFLLVFVVPKIGFAGACDFYLLIDGIPGESTDDKHKGWIDVISWDWGSKRQRLEGLKFTMHVNKASPKLFLASVSAQPIRSAVLSVCGATGDKVEILRIHLSHVAVTSFKTEGIEVSPSLPLNEVTLVSSRAVIQYSEVDHRTGKSLGITKSGWDMSSNQEIK